MLSQFSGDTCPGSPDIIFYAESSMRMGTEYYTGIIIVLFTICRIEIISRKVLYMSNP